MAKLMTDELIAELIVTAVGDAPPPKTFRERMMLQMHVVAYICSECPKFGVKGATELEICEEVAPVFGDLFPQSALNTVAS